MTDEDIRRAVTSLTAETPPARSFESLTIGSLGVLTSPRRPWPTWAIALTASAGMLVLVFAASLAFRSSDPSPVAAAPTNNAEGVLSLDWQRLTISEDAGRVTDVEWTGSTFVVLTETGRMFAREGLLIWEEISGPGGSLGREAQLTTWNDETVVLWMEGHAAFVARSEDLATWDMEQLGAPDLPPPSEPNPFPEEPSGFVIGAVGTADELVVAFNFDYPVGPIEGTDANGEAVTGYQFGTRSALWMYEPNLDTWAEVESPFGAESYLLQMWMTADGVAVAGAESSLDLNQASWTTAIRQGDAWEVTGSSVVPILNGPGQAVVSDGVTFVMRTHLFCCGGDESGFEFYSSPDGVAWEPTFSDSLNTGLLAGRTLAGGEEGFVLVADGIFFSRDGQSWVHLVLPEGFPPVSGRAMSVAVGDGVLIGLGMLEGNDESTATEIIMSRGFATTLVEPGQ